METGKRKNSLTLSLFIDFDKKRVLRSISDPKLLDKNLSE